MIIDYEIENTEHKLLAFFEFPNLSYFIQVLYQIIAFVSLHLAVMQSLLTTSADLDLHALALSPP